MKHLFIINPFAGKGGGVAYAKEIEKHFMKSKELGNKESYYIEFTKGPGDATEIARKYVESDRCRVYAIGGDGTLNEVLNGVMGSSSSLGVIPAGSGNDFFRNIGDTVDSSLLYRTINGTEEYIDVGRVNGRYFLNVASVGIDAEIVANARKFKKYPMFFGMSSYIAGIFYTVFRYRSFNSIININGMEHNKETLLLTVANGKYYGGGMKIAPRASINDGSFDAYHIDRANPLKIVLFFPQLIRGRHEGFKEVEHFMSEEIRIRSEERFLLNVDGEIFDTCEAAFNIIPNGLKMIVPLKTQIDIMYNM
ncbi:diacylglycerol/lipid kinase family protein [Acetivibrio straminisolvens]|uniref:Transcription regulator n=1 Tax=Acetivibrio straminisolvens JCM 21531 TaxID=1294263 RepID=W4VB75_9FIRM|nr:diacylglycerol kinase family protein [Acetivibrio straminisolvens]GAE90416.1 transcription regulator [Acetivibrio straminisolvens JCM 21531]